MLTRQITATRTRRYARVKERTTQPWRVVATNVLITITIIAAHVRTNACSRRLVVLESVFTWLMIRGIVGSVTISV